MFKYRLVFILMIYMDNMSKVGHTLRISEENYQYMREYAKKLARRKEIDPLDRFNFSSVLSLYIADMERLEKKYKKEGSS